MSDSRYPVPLALPQAPHETSLVIRRSRFLAQAAVCASKAEVRDFVARIRNLYPDATHNCWASVPGAPGSTAQAGSSDDGEPHGTAGRPMLQILLHSGIGDICVVVTRWFGGVKLGTGGLVRAYQDSVRENLASLATTLKTPMTEMVLTLDYCHLDSLRRALAGLEARITGEDYQDRVRLTLTLPEENATALLGQAANLGKGAITCEPAKG